MSLRLTCAVFKRSRFSTLTHKSNFTPILLNSRFFSKESVDIPPDPTKDHRKYGELHNFAAEDESKKYAPRGKEEKVSVDDPAVKEVLQGKDGRMLYVICLLLSSFLLLLND